MIIASTTVARYALKSRFRIVRLVHTRHYNILCNKFISHLLTKTIFFPDEILS